MDKTPIKTLELKESPKLKNPTATKKAAHDAATDVAVAEQEPKKEPKKKNLSDILVDPEAERKRILERAVRAEDERSQ